MISVILPLSAQQWSAVTPEEAQSHLLKRVQTAYPPFARPGSKPKPWSAPDFSSMTFDDVADSVKIPAPSPEMEKWLQENAARKSEECSASVDNLTIKRLRDNTSLVDIDDRRGSYQLYLVTIGDRCICGATGNCEIDIVEVDPGRIRIVGSASGWGYALVHRELSVPDVFLIQNMSAADSVVRGFAKVGGEWGQLYCGAGKNDHLAIEQCR